MVGDYSSEQDGKYVIRVGKHGDAWIARAFRGRQPVTDCVRAADRGGAVQVVRDTLQRLRDAQAAARGNDGTPSVAEYREAFEQLSLHPHHLAMLKAHLHAPDHLITATQLAEAAGYANWNAANLQYGLLAQRVAEQLDYAPPRRDDGSPIWTATLATWPGESDLPGDQLVASMVESAHFQWHMRPQVRAVVGDL